MNTRAFATTASTPAAAPLLTAALLVSLAPVPLQAQDGWWDWSLWDLAVRVDIRASGAPHHVPDVVYAPAPRARPAPTRARRVKARKGPAFCRSGAGHPVFGRRWCAEKGFGLGGPAWGPIRWERRHWLDALPRTRRGDRLGPLGDRGLLDVLGPTVYERLHRERLRFGTRAPLTGRWLRPRSTSLVLQIRSGPVALAELTDFGGDGWFDVVLVAGG